MVAMYHMYDPSNINRETLVQDQDFLNDARTFLKNRENYSDESLSDPQDLFDAYMEHFRIQNVNEVTAIRDLGHANRLSKSGNTEELSAFGRLMDTYDSVDSEWDLKAVGDYVGGIFTSPTTYGGMATFGAAKIGGIAAKKGVQYTLRKVLKDQLARNAMKKSFIASSAVEGVGVFSTVAAQEQARVLSTDQEEINWKNVSVATGISSLAGGALSQLTTAQKLISSNKAGFIHIKNKKVLEETVAKVHSKYTVPVFNGTTKSANAERTAKHAKKIRQKLLLPFSETIPEILAEGKILQKVPSKLQKIDEFKDGRPYSIAVQELDNLSAAGAKIVDLIDEKLIAVGSKDLGEGVERFGSKLSQAIGMGLVDGRTINPILKRHNVQLHQLGPLVAEELSHAGTLLGVVGNATKKQTNMYKRNFVALNHLDDLLLGQGFSSITKKAREELMDVAPPLSRMIWNGTKVLSRTSVGMMTIQIATTVRNTTNGFMRNTTYALDNLYTGKLNELRGKTGKPWNYEKLLKEGMTEKEAAEIAKKLVLQGQAQVAKGASAATFKDLLFGITSPESQALFKILQDPAFGQKDEVLRLIRGLGDLADVTGTEKGLLGATRWANSFNTMSDNSFKRAIYHRELNELVRINPIKIKNDVVTTLDDVGYRVDNPTTKGVNPTYIAQKRMRVEEEALNTDAPAVKKFFNGPTTAYMGTDNTKPLFLKTDFVAKLKGANDEIPISGGSKYDELLARVKKTGWDANQDGNKIMIGVNHKGEAYILEGNNRAAIAKKMNVPSVKVEVKYFNGAEDVKGIYSPANMLKNTGEKFTELNSIDKVMREGQFSQVPSEYIAKAMEEAFEFTYQFSRFGEMEGGANKFANLILKVGANPFGALFTPFPRYLINQFRFWYSHAPLLGSMNVGGILNKPKTKGGLTGTKSKIAIDGETIGKQLAGLTTLGAFLGIRTNFGDETTGAFTFINPISGERVDARALLGPYSMFAFASDVIYRSNLYGIATGREEKDWNPYNNIVRSLADSPFETKELIEAAIGQLGRGGTGIWMIDEIVKAAQGSSDNPENLARNLAKILGSIPNRVIVGAGMLKDLAASIDTPVTSTEDYTTLPDNSDVDAMKVFVLSATRSLPTRFDIGGEKYDLGDWIRGKDHPLREDLNDPINPRKVYRINPIMKQFTGLTDQPKQPEVNREFSRLKIKWRDYAPRKLKGGDYLNNISKKIMANQIDISLKKEINDEMYLNLATNEMKEKYLKTRLGTLKGIVRKLVLGFTQMDAPTEQSSDDYVKDYMEYLNTTTATIFENLSNDKKREINQRWNIKMGEELKEYYKSPFFKDIPKPYSAGILGGTPEEEGYTRISLEAMLWLKEHYPKVFKIDKIVTKNR